MCSVPKHHQPPQGAYFDTLTVLYQNEKYWPHAVFWQHILDLGYFMFSKVNILGKINIFRTCFVLQKWIWSSSLKKNTQCSNKTIRVCGDAPTPLYTNSHITYQQSSSSFHLEKYLFTENDIYFSEQIFISLNINLKLKSTLKGSFTIFWFSVRSNILNSNGVWYSWFCPEGPINASNSKFLFFYFVPRDLDSQRHMGPRLAAQGTLTSSAGDLDSQRHGKSMALRVKVPCAAS